MSVNNSKINSVPIPQRLQIQDGIRIAKPPQIDHSFNILVVGHAGTGKTSLVRRWATNNFNAVENPDETYEPVEIYVKLAGRNIRLYILISAGQYKLDAQVQNYAQEIQGVLFVYSLHPDNSQERFDKIMNFYLPTLNRHCSYDFHAGVVATKCDLPNAVSTEDHEKKVASLGLAFTKVSAKDNYNVDVAFHSLVNKILQSCLSKDAVNKIPGALKTRPRRYVEEPSGGSWCRTS